MINVKDQVYAALSSIDTLKNVTDLYPKDWLTLPCVQYVEEENRIESVSDTEDYSYVRYAVYIWSAGSTSDIALEINDKLYALGLRRSQCADANDPSGLRHKVMRFEGIIDNSTEVVYQNN